MAEPFDDCPSVPTPPSPHPIQANNEFKFRYDLGQVIDGGISPVDACFYSAGGADGTLFVLCGTLIMDCVMCRG